MTVNFAGHLYNDAGSAISGASVKLLETGTTTQEGSTVTTDSDGAWDFTEADQDRYDVEITSGSSVRRIRWDDQISLKELDARNNTGATTPAATFSNITDAVANQVAVFSGANATRADNDEIYLSFKLADSAGNLDEFARMTAVATDVTSGSEDGQIEFDVIKAGTLTKVWTITSSTGAAMSFDMNVDALTIGSGADTDVSLTFDANSADGVITWMEDEDYFKFSDEILMNSTEKILFGDTATFIHQSSDGVMTVDGEATIDLNASTAVLVSNDLKLNSDSAVLGFGADNDTTLTHTDGTGLTLNSTNKLTFGDTGTFIHQSSDGVLTIESDATVDINGAVAFNGALTGITNITLSGTLSDGNYTFDTSGNVSGLGTVASGAITSSGIIKTDDTTAATSTTDGSLQTDGGLSVALDAVIGDDVFLLSDSAVFNMGAGSDFTITHDGTTGATLAGNPITITSATAATWSTAAGVLTIDGDDGIVLQTTGSGDVTSNDNVVLIDSAKLSFGTGSDSQIYYDGTDTFWDLRAAGTGDLMIALAGSFPSPDPGAVHIWNGDASQSANTNAHLIVEGSGASGIQILGGAASNTSIWFGDSGSENAGIFQYAHDDTQFEFWIEATRRLHYGLQNGAAAFAFQEATTISTSTNDLTLAPAASLNVTLNDDDGDALDFANSAVSYYTIDTRNTASNANAHQFDTEDATIASAHNARYRLASFPSYTLNYTGTTQVTSLITNIRMQSATLAGDTATLTVDKATTLELTAPAEGTNVNLTASSALRILDPGGGVPAVLHGVYIEDVVQGTAGYGITIEGADTAAIWVQSADPIRHGTAGSATGTATWEGATSGVVTMTVAAAAGTWTLTLPPDDGDAGEQLQTNGSGVSTWEAAGSLAQFKEVHGILEPQAALDKMLSINAFEFNYKRPEADAPRMTNTGDFDTTYAGVMGDEFREVMHHNGRIFSPVSAFGYTVQAVKALEAKIAHLEEVLKRR